MTTTRRELETKIAAAEVQVIRTWEQEGKRHTPKTRRAARRVLNLKAQLKAAH